MGAAHPSPSVPEKPFRGILIGCKDMADSAIKTKPQRTAPPTVPGGICKPMSLGDIAYEEIKLRIITCALRPGEYVNENILSQELGLGRTPVHQALNRLMLQGLVEVIPRKGVIIKPVSLDEIVQAAEVRLINEREAACLASERITPEEIDAMEQVLARAEIARQNNDIMQLMLLDREFHILLATATRNPILAEILQNLHERSLRVWFISLNAPDHLLKVHGEHEAIVAALRTHDRDAAAKAVTGHIMSYRGNIMRHI